MMSKLSGSQKQSVLSKPRLSHFGMAKRQDKEQLSKMDLERLITSAEINFQKSKFSVSNASFVNASP